MTVFWVYDNDRAVLPPCCVFNVSLRAVADCNLIENHIVCDLMTQFTVNHDLELSNVCHTHDVY